MTSVAKSSGPPGVRSALLWLILATAAEAAIVIAHFVYSAHLYDDPYRNHVVVPVAMSLATVMLLAALFGWRGWKVALWLLAVAAGLPFVAMFGLYHGGFGHVLKLLFFAAGTSPERLLEIFDSPDFAIPNDVLFEISGVLCFVASLAVAHLLIRVLRLARHERGSARGSAPTVPSAAQDH